MPGRAGEECEPSSERKNAAPRSDLAPRGAYEGKRLVRGIDIDITGVLAQFGRELSVIVHDGVLG